MTIQERIRSLFSKSRLAPHIAAGRRGEDIAAAFLLKNGYRLLRRNTRLGKDEIDIIAFDPIDRVYVFAEVKTRTKADADYRPEINITHNKRFRMARAARKFMASCDEDVGYRLDVLCVMDGKVTDHFVEIAWTDESRDSF